MKILRILFLLSLATLSGCAQYFEPMKPDNCWMCFDGPSWTVEGIHVHVNRLVVDKYYQPRRPHMKLNGLCLETAEIKYEMALAEGHKPQIIIIRLHKEVEYLRGATSPHHAVLLVNDTIYDNGFISHTPFDREYLSRYGREIPDVWSDYRKTK